MLGSPIAHSLSPALHRAAYRALGLDNWTYEAIECDEAGLPARLGSLGPEWVGLSLTMPLKRAVLPLLDQAELLVTNVGAANTVVLADGRRVGHNTDVSGIATALRSAGVTPSGTVAVIGAGATACAALAAIGADVTAEVTVAVRTPARAEPLLAVARQLGVQVRVIELATLLVGGGWDLVISTVPGGAADPLGAQLAAGVVTAGAVFDVVYEPWPTALAATAAEAGMTVISGYDMLVHQAARQVELMTGRPAPVAAMYAAGLAERDRRRNNRSLASANPG